MIHFLGSFRGLANLCCSDCFFFFFFLLQGKAIVFFPCFADGVMDTRTLHAALPAEDVKWVSQIWIRQANFEGTTGRPESSSDEEDDNDEADVQHAFGASTGGGGADAPAAADQ